MFKKRTIKYLLTNSLLTVTDESGNRNNCFSVPIGEQHSTSQDLSDQVADAAERSSVPVTVLEKTDDEPKHGDDFGSEATAARKLAHEKRAADADPDFVVVKEEDSTSNDWTVAAEVADSAALLDKGVATPTVPDELAGKIGLRRLSNTPIEDVARVAAEVAQTAASLDADNEDDSDVKQEAQHAVHPSIPEGEEISSGYETPAQDRVPLFSHECCSLPSDDEPEEHDRAPHIEIHNEGDNGPIDVHDPTLEEFPCDRDLVLEKVRTIESSLGADRTSFDGTPSSPVMGLDLKKERLDLSPAPSSVLRTPEISPSLDSIVEEGEKEELPSPLDGSFDEIKDTVYIDEEQDDKQQAPTSNQGNSEEHLSPQPLRSVDGVDEPPVSSEESAADQNRRDLAGDKDTTSGPESIVSQEETKPSNMEKKMEDTLAWNSVAAESTAIAGENDNAQLKSRSHQSTSAHSFSSSSSSPQRSGKHESHSAIKEVCGLAWVDWLGGIAMKLCGSKQHT
ncbi:hypothetical protein F5884DRAFT_684598 [Xylogone sp. PMI_703]|nr:hypothetical protein F5884DRAFT_684598 [Xylogone sp. PMI_703]